jgi:hypothetical protein
MKKPLIFCRLFILLAFLGRGSPGQSYRVPIEILRDPGGELSLDDILNSYKS